MTTPYALNVGLFATETFTVRCAGNTAKGI